jgi:hypothetical protein
MLPLDSVHAFNERGLKHHRYLRAAGHLHRWRFIFHVTPLYSIYRNARDQRRLLLLLARSFQSLHI